MMKRYKLSLLMTMITTWLMEYAMGQRYACDPCLDRSSFKIQALVHGQDSSPSFWQQVQAAMNQASKDMGVDFEINLYENESDDTNMASDIIAANADALIVTIPSPTVEDAVEQVVDKGTPVFGFQMGYQVAKSLGLINFVGMDDALAGQAAAAEFKKLKPDQALKAIFVNPDDSSGVFAARRIGFEDSLENHTVEELMISNPTDASSTSSQLAGAFQGCSYDAILLASSDLVTETVSALEANNCDFNEQLLAVFDTNPDVHQVLSEGKLAFTVSEQQYLQGALSVVLASLYATTGHTLAPSSESDFGLQAAGPAIITKEDVPSDSLAACEDDAFPICPNTMALDGVTPSECGCIDRKRLKIAGVLHAFTTDAFWDIVYSATEQAKMDFDIDLELDRFEPVDSDVLYLKMATKIEALCSEGAVDGIFVTIPNEAVHLAIQLCLNLTIPVVSINAGPDFSKDLGLAHHIGMVERNAGFEGGKRMAATGQITRALCLMHVPDHVVLLDRCGGFEDGIAGEGDGSIEFLGSINVPDDNQQQFIQIVEDKIGEDGDWAGLGIMLAGQPQGEPGLKLKDRHPAVLLGSFDTSDLHYKAIDEGKLLFTIDQGAYLQGYMPIPLLAWQAYAKQQLQNHLVESGPAFIVKAPSESQKVCEANHFMACEAAEPGNDAANAAATSTGSGGLNQGAVIALSVIAAFLVLAVIFLGYRVHKLNRHVSELKAEGKTMPRLSMQHYLSSVVTPVDKVVGSSPEPEVL